MESFKVESLVELKVVIVEYLSQIDLILSQIDLKLGNIYQNRNISKSS